MAKRATLLLYEAGGYLFTAQKEGDVQRVLDHKCFFKFLLIKVLSQDFSGVSHSVQYLLLVRFTGSPRLFKNVAAGMYSYRNVFLSEL